MYSAQGRCGTAMTRRSLSSSRPSERCADAWYELQPRISQAQATARICAQIRLSICVWRFAPARPMMPNRTSAKVRALRSFYRRQAVRQSGTAQSRPDRSAPPKPANSTCSPKPPARVVTMTMWYGDASRCRAAKALSARVGFARANPALFRLIFASSPQTLGNFATNSQANLLLQPYAAQQAQAPGDQARTGAVQARALVLGLARMMLEGRIPRDERLIDQSIK